MIGAAFCVATIVGVWMLRSEVAWRVESIDGRIVVRAERASAANQNVRRAMETARADVNRVRNESANLASDPDKKRQATVLRKLVHQRVGPDIGDLGGRLATASDAAVAVVSLLQTFQELSIGQTERIDSDKLEGAANRMSQLTAALQKLETSVDENDNVPRQESVAAAANGVDLALQRCQTTVDAWQSGLDAARQQLHRLKAQILGWLTLAAIAVTVLFAWLGLSQISLFVHAWKWFMRPSSTPPGE